MMMVIHEWAAGIVMPASLEYVPVVAPPMRASTGDDAALLTVVRPVCDGHGNHLVSASLRW
jgi:hypothetical protein